MAEPKTDPSPPLTLEDVRNELVALLHDLRGEVQSLRTSVVRIADDQAETRAKAEEANIMATKNRLAGVRSAQAYLETLNGAGGE